MLGSPPWWLSADLAVEFLVYNLAKLGGRARRLFAVLAFFPLLAALPFLGTEARALLVDFLAFYKLNQLAMLLDLCLGCVFVVRAVRMLSVSDAQARPRGAKLARIEGGLSRALQAVSGFARRRCPRCLYCFSVALLA